MIGDRQWAVWLDRCSSDSQASSHAGLHQAYLTEAAAQMALRNLQRGWETRGGHRCHDSGDWRVCQIEIVSGRWTPVPK